ncbi:ABC transporter substrate-binding protein [Pararhodospirillum oryzae]|uniref:Sulfonate/nitrate/taurine transport system substrate-binding protein n=1 Tax=Pararhodospirillum oryzae TaxID=478448 RepID=A0A512HA40_9PROT|nr:ABC transporter substrate-binding protein [Pararhodospirillum oryzae]GEO82316.1 sulfonate/nitrate/taurine transport system substrate-binding protein [Pararhodospirillum oryzae]
MSRVDRRTFLAQALAGTAAGAAWVAGLPAGRVSASDLPSLTITAMPAAPSVVIAHAAETLAASGLADPVSFSLWKNPDQMRAGALSGKVDLFANPSYSCANLRNRGVPVRMLNILTWGLFHVIAADEAVQRPEDLAGRKVVVAFKNDAPDLIFRLVLGHAGLKAGQDVEITYVGSPMEAAQLLLAGRTDIAVLPEPSASAAIMQGRQRGRSLFRALDLTAELARQTGRPARIAQAGLGVQEDLVQRHPEVVKAFHEACIRATEWVTNNPVSAGRLGEEYLGVKGPVLAQSIPHVRLQVTASADAREDIEFLLTSLMSLNPDITGGRLPDDGYYWSA